MTTLSFDAALSWLAGYSDPSMVIAWWNPKFAVWNTVYHEYPQVPQSVVDDFKKLEKGVEDKEKLLAEVERGGPVVDLSIPTFCVTEVSEDDRFRNEYLAHQPYGAWADAHRRELDLLGPTFVSSLGENRFDTTSPMPDGA